MPANKDMAERLTEAELAEEAQSWLDHTEKWPPHLLPSRTLYLPSKTWAIIDELARRSNVTQDVLIQQWIDDRVRQEAMKFIAREDKIQSER
jgi:hypothetical protein